MFEPETPFHEWYHHVCCALEYLGHPPAATDDYLWRLLWERGLSEWEAIMRHPLPAARFAAERLAIRQGLAVSLL